MAELDSKVKPFLEGAEPRVFTIIRESDESGVSGTGRVLDGVVFHNGQVVVCWRGDITSEKSGYSSLAIYPCWDAFQRVHIDAHPKNETRIIFGHDTELPDRIAGSTVEKVRIEHTRQASGQKVTVEKG